MHRTPAYWPTRVLLGVGVLSTVLVVGAALLVATAPDPMFGQPSTFLGIPGRVLAGGAAIAMAAVGLARMLWVFCGPRDHQPSTWRYRRHR